MEPLPANVPTVVAVGPFDDPEHVAQLAVAYAVVQRQCMSQLVLLRLGARVPTAELGLFQFGHRGSVHVTCSSHDERWTTLVASADLVVLPPSSPTTILLDGMDLGRPVVAPICPASTEMVVPAIAGLLYPPGDASAMAAAMLRLLTTPVLRRGMGGRATKAARLYRAEHSLHGHAPWEVGAKW